jgi:hypothetical protein
MYEGSTHAVALRSSSLSGLGVPLALGEGLGSLDLTSVLGSIETKKKRKSALLCLGGVWNDLRCPFLRY